MCALCCVITVVSSDCSSSTQQCSTQTFVIDESVNSTVGCNCPVENDCSCNTLMDALRIAFPRQYCGYVFELHGGKTHFVNGENHTTWDVGTFTLKSMMMSSMIVCNQSGVGWSFYNSLYCVEISNVTFVNCSLARQRSSSHNETLSTALLFDQSKVITLINTTIYTTCFSTGIIMLNSSSATILNGSFVGPKGCPKTGSHTVEGGGGVVLELAQLSGPEGTGFEFINCTFTNLSSLPSSYFGKGGGLSILVNSGASSCLFNVSGCKFLSNSGFQGGGLFASFLDVSSNSLVVSGCNFSNNLAQHHGGGLFINLTSSSSNSLEINGNVFLGNVCQFTGGGVYIESSPIPPTNVLYRCSDNTISNNSAQAGAGGGLYILLRKSPGSTEITGGYGVCEIKRTTFCNNTALFGSAVWIQQLQTSRHQASFSVLELRDCTFERNRIPKAGQSGMGTVYSNQVDVWFPDNVTFEGNDGPALALVNSMANFSNTVATFANNTADSRGGAILLLGSSYFTINNQTVMNFSSNSAGYQGGAIYKHYQGQLVSHGGSDCFVKHEDDTLPPDSWEATFIFQGNRVGGINNSIHTTSVKPCNYSVSPTFCWKGWTYDSPTNAITTDANEVLSAIEVNFSAVPGWPVHKSVISLRDDFNNSVSSDMLYFSNTSGITTLDTLSVYKESGNTVSLSLISIGDRSLHFEASVKLTACPPGFVLSKNGNSCVCISSIYKAYDSIIKCFREARVAILLADYWLGNASLLGVSGTGLYAGICPPHLCRKNRSLPLQLPNDYHSLNEDICHQERQGVLCGECRPGFCLSINTWNHKCINSSEMNLPLSILKYTAAVYIPYLLLLLTIVVFNFRLMKGSLNGFIIFAQMITSAFDLTHHDSISLKKTKNFVSSYRFLYGVFNLDFLEKYVGSLCLSADLTILSILLLNYLLLIAPVLMIVIIAVGNKISNRIKWKQKVFSKKRAEEQESSYTKYFPCLSKPQRENVILMLSTVILLSYTKLSITSAQILHTEKVTNLSSGKSITTRVFLTGQIDSNAPSYLYYKIPAIISFIYLLLILMLLLDYPLRLIEFIIKRVGVLRAIYPSALVYEFVSEFQRCFKPNRRFFSGVYFAFRILISLMYVFKHLSVAYLILEISSACLLLLVVIFKPYKNNIYNVIDILIFFNLVIINAFNFYQSGHLHHNKPERSIFNLQYVLAMIPIACFIFCICFRLILRYEPVRKYMQALIRKEALKFTRISFSLPYIQNHRVLEDADDDPSDFQGASDSTLSREPATCSTSRGSGGGGGGLLAEEQRSSHNPNIPVTIVDVCGKDMGEAPTYQTSLSEGYYLKTEWNSGIQDYGTISRGRH